MSKMFERLERRIMLLIGRAIVQAISSDGGRIVIDGSQLKGEASKKVELAESTGFTAVPLPGAELVALSIMGERGNKVAISMGDRRHRPRDLVPGEAAMFDDQVQRIAIRRDHIEVISPKKVIVKSPTIEIEADSATINERAIATVGDLVDVQGGSSAGRHPIVTGVGDPQGGDDG